MKLFKKTFYRYLTWRNSKEWWRLADQEGLVMVPIVFELPTLNALMTGLEMPLDGLVLAPRDRQMKAFDLGYIVAKPREVELLGVSFVRDVTFAAVDLMNAVDGNSTTEELTTASHNLRLALAKASEREQAEGYKEDDINDEED